MNPCDSNLLSAYVDGELDPEVHQRVEAHVLQCARCQAELKDLREMSAAFGRYSLGELSQIERGRLHQRLDEEMNADANADARIWKLGGVIGLIAASILVVASTWLATLPPARSGVRSGPAVGGNGTIARAKPAEWEQVALTLRVSPLPDDVGDQVYLADAHLDEWMLGALNGGRP
jgi:anti-sigma factor RsiW